MFWFILGVLALLAFSVLYLRGENLNYLDSGGAPLPVGEPSAAHGDVLRQLAGFRDAGRNLRGRARLRAIREYMDSMSDGKSFSSTFSPVSAGDVRGEWVLAPGADSKRRILYIHGGAWIAGSPRSHRAITDRLSAVANAAVLSLDYPLMPEHRRQQGIDACRTAYRWILDNGPDGVAAADFVLVAGDSAGGSLTLSLIAWARDVGLRAPDAAVAFSPSTDVTLSSPSLRENLATDPMLGPAFGQLTRVPSLFLWWGSWFTTRLRPSDPAVSPLRGDLSNLPPVLVQASEAEMLLDDARRYVAKAQAAGSPVELQTWPHMVHVWQIFTPELDEAEEAFDNIAEFIENVEATGTGIRSV